ncbi:sigma factor G inhibitor Gin [Carboxydothermus pertinax]|uniref:sigma factor G inhibitor Gin n=1 Tax=Carboxydothermus pertinax TaxID=870242 RepID=UPI00098117BB
MFMYCNFCHAPKDRGIRLGGKFLCQECEKILTHLTAANPVYSFIVKRFRNFLFKYQ